MIPDEKLFEIIKYAGSMGFHIHIFGNFGTVEISMYTREILRYNWSEPKIKIIKTYYAIEKESTVEAPISHIERETKYYSEMLKIANMLQDNIIMNDDTEA